MTTTLKRPAYKAYNLKRKIHGVGINDVPGAATQAKQLPRHYYTVWSGVLKRCYSPREQARYPTYIGCTVDPRWHYLSNFKQWYDEQGDVTSKQLDKDIISPGNKVYGPDTCFFVPFRLNAFFIKRDKLRGKYPIGVFHDPRALNKRFACSMSIAAGKTKHLGYYSTPEEAYQAFIQAKKKVLLEKFIFPETDQRLKQALYNVYNNMEEYFK